MRTEEAVEALVRRRVEVGDDSYMNWAESFCWKLRGGAWNGAHRGTAFDCYADYVRRGSQAQDFVAAFPSLRNSASFSIVAYTDAGALTLARAWIHKMSVLFQLCLEKGSSDTREVTTADVAGYVEPPELDSLAAGATGALAARIGQIRSLMPR